jgi:hypothetical protein
MLHVNASKLRQFIGLAFGLLVIALAGFALAQNSGQKSDSELTLRDVLVREGNNGIRLKDPSKFKLDKGARGKFAVSFKASKKLLGTGGCGVCPGGDCDFLLDSPTSGRCRGCGGSNDCTLDPFE